MANPAKRGKEFQIFALNSQEIITKTFCIENLQKIRSELATRYNQPVENLQVIEDLIKLWFDKADDGQESVQKKLPAPCTYVKVHSKKDVNQEVFSCTKQSLQRLLEVTEQHRGYCEYNLKIKKNV